jgi:hypothetical protein
MGPYMHLVYTVGLWSDILEYHQTRILNANIADTLNCPPHNPAAYLAFVSFWISCASPDKATSLSFSKVRKQLEYLFTISGQILVDKGRLVMEIWFDIFGGSPLETSPKQKRWHIPKRPQSS